MPSCMFSRILHRLQVFLCLVPVCVFLRLVPVACFPELGTWLHFPALGTGLHVFPRLVPVTTFPAYSYIFLRTFYMYYRNQNAPIQVYCSSFDWFIAEIYAFV